MSSQCFTLILIIVSIDAQLHHLHIGGLFNPTLDDQQAAQIAIEQINHHALELFDGHYQLTLLVNHSQCDPIYIVDAFFHALFRRPQLIFLVGTSCSNETKAVIQVAHFYNLILFSHSDSFISPVNQTYSTLVRLSVSDENYNDARVAWIRANHWSHVAIIHQDTIDYSLMMATLAKRLNQSNINVILTQSASMMNLTSALHTLQEKKARVVFVNFDTSSRARFFCEVYRTFSRELRERYVWILTDYDYPAWNFHTTNCTRREILQAARGHIIVDSSYEQRANLHYPTMTVEELQRKLHRNEPLKRQTLHAYDSMWVIASLIQASMKSGMMIETFSYEAKQMRDRWLNQLEQIHFLGVSGPVSFRNGRRRAETVISQFQIHRDHQRLITIAEYSQVSGLNVNCSRCGPLVWPGLIPVDTERSVTRRVVMNTLETALITGGCVVGLALAIFFLTFNIVHRRERYIKLSSPNLNNIILIGAMHIHISCLLFALDRWFLKYDLLGWACMLRILLFSGGFSLTFGSMFLKTLRVHRIFTSRNRPLLHSKLLQDHHLLLLCFCLYFVDIIFASLWQYFDPHTVQFAYQPIRRVNVDMVARDEIYYCDSHYRPKILPLIYIYKSFFLVIGGYLAAKTRHVHIPALNDSKFIVWSIYGVVLTSLFTALLMISMKSLEILVFICLVVILMTSAILCLVFLPKVIRLKHHHNTLHEVVSRDLVVDDSRTRRLAIEISYFEKYRYAQLQNRELKSELVRLCHLVNILEQKIDPSSNATLALLPIAVRWASSFLHKSDYQLAAHRSLSKACLEVNTPMIEQEPIQQTISNPSHDQHSIHSDHTLCAFDPMCSSSSSSADLDLSLNCQSSSLRLSAISTDDEATFSLSSSSSSMLTISEKELTLYLCLSDEVQTNLATVESDLDKIERDFD